MIIQNLKNLRYNILQGKIWPEEKRGSIMPEFWLQALEPRQQQPYGLHRGKILTRKAETAAHRVIGRRKMYKLLPPGIKEVFLPQARTTAPSPQERQAVPLVTAHNPLDRWAFVVADVPAPWGYSIPFEVCSTTDSIDEAFPVIRKILKNIFIAMKLVQNPDLDTPTPSYSNRQPLKYPKQGSFWGKKRLDSGC